MERAISTQAIAAMAVSSPYLIGIFIDSVRQDYRMSMINMILFITKILAWLLLASLASRAPMQVSLV